MRGRGIAAMVYEGDNGYNAAIFQVTVDTKTGKVVVDALLVGAGLRARAEPATGCEAGRGLPDADDQPLADRGGQVGPERDHLERTGRRYPVIRFNAMPKLHFRIIDRKDEESMGAGEVLITNGPAAIANAIFDATGKRHAPAAVHSRTGAGGAGEVGSRPGTGFVAS